MEPPVRRSRLPWLLDAALFLSFTVLEVVPATGLPVHEWLGVAVVGAVVLHLLLEWPWIASRARRLPRTGEGRVRVAWLLNLALFGAFAATTVSGLAESEFVLSRLGLPPGRDFRWHTVHEGASTALLFLAALHVALNWDLVLGAVRTRLAAGGASRGMDGAAAPVRVRLGFVALAALVFAAATLAWHASVAPPVLVGPGGGRIRPVEVLRAVRRQKRSPDQRRAALQLAAKLALGALAGAAGRRLLGLRLGGSAPSRSPGEQLDGRRAASS